MTTVPQENAHTDSTSIVQMRVTNSHIGSAAFPGLEATDCSHRPNGHFIYFIFLYMSTLEPTPRRIRNNIFTASSGAPRAPPTSRTASLPNMKGSRTKTGYVHGGMASKATSMKQQTFWKSSAIQVSAEQEHASAGQPAIVDHKVDPVIFKLCNEKKPTATDPVWRLLRINDGGYSLSWAALFLGCQLTPECPKRTAGNAQRWRLLCHIHVALAVLDLAAAAANRPPWYKRMRLLLAPSLRHLCDADSVAIALVRSIIDADHLPAVHGLIYGLYTKDNLYIGKTKLKRADDNPGAVARFREHYIALRKPSSQEAKRYKKLRNPGIECVRFLPLILADTSAQLTNLETTAIRQVAPSLNGRDAANRFFQPIATSIKPSRSRPFRRKTHLKDACLWTLPCVAKKLAQFEDNDGVIMCQEPYARFYSVLSARVPAPISIYDPSNAMLCGAYLSTTRATLPKPSSWCVQKWAQFLYQVAIALQAMCSHMRRSLATCKLDRISAAFSLPPRIVPPLVIPWCMTKTGIQYVKRVLHRMLFRLPCEAARRWMRCRVRIVFGSVQKLSSRVNAPASCSRFQLHKFLSRPAFDIGYAATCPSLRTVGRDYNMPFWPDHDDVLTGLNAGFGRWTLALRMSKRAKKVRRRVPLPILGLARPACNEWMDRQRSMLEALRGHDVVVLDDRDRSKLWGVKSDHLSAAVLQQIAADNQFLNLG